jgi:hypothetical protein
MKIHCKKINNTLVAASNSELEKIERLKSDEVYAFTTRLARSYPFHKRLFAMFKLGFENQDEATTLDSYRKYMIIRSGRYELIGGMKIAHSMSYENMDQKAIEELSNDILNLLIQDLHISSEDFETELTKFY